VHRAFVSLSSILIQGCLSFSHVGVLVVVVLILWATIEARVLFYLLLPSVLYLI
jgi:hypothetical protein